MVLPPVLKTLVSRPHRPVPRLRWSSAPRLRLRCWLCRRRLRLDPRRLFCRKSANGSHCSPGTRSKQRQHRTQFNSSSRSSWNICSSRCSSSSRSWFNYRLICWTPWLQCNCNRTWTKRPRTNCFWDSNTSQGQVQKTGLRWNWGWQSLLQMMVRPPVLKSLVSRPHTLVPRLLHAPALRLRLQPRHLRRRLRLRLVPRRLLLQGLATPRNRFCWKPVPFSGSAPRPSSQVAPAQVRTEKLGAN